MIKNKKIQIQKGWSKLKRSGSLLWRTTQTVVDALITPIEEYNAKMLNKRFEFMTKSIAKLDKIIPECFKVYYSLASFSL